MRRGRRSLVGIDMGPLIRAAQIVPERARGRRAIAFAAPDTGAVSPSVALHDLRRRLIRWGRECVVCPKRTDVMIESIAVPHMPPAELHGVVQRAIEARRWARVAPRGHSAAPMAPPRLDVRILGTGSAHDDPSRREVIAVAMEHSAITSLTSDLDTAGWRPVSIISHVEALLHAVTAEGAAERRPMVVVEVDRAGTTVLVVCGRRIALCRPLGICGLGLDAAVAHHLSVDAEAAVELRRRRMDAGPNLESTEEPNGRVTPAVERAARSAVRPMLEDLATAVRMSVRGFGYSFRGPSPGGLILVGSEAQEPRLACTLAERTGLPVRAADQWTSLAGAGMTAPSWPRRVGGAVVAAGLIHASGRRSADRSPARRAA